MKRLLLILVTLLIAGCSGAHRATSSADGAPATAAQLEDERESFERINAARREQGLPPLSYDPQLAGLARAHSADMLAADFFEHDSPNTGSLEDRLVRADILFREARENIAQHRDIQEAHASLMQSPGHRANILAPTVTHVGVGVVYDGFSIIVTQVFADRVTALTETQAVTALSEGIEATRSERGLAPLTRAPGLDALAADVAERLASGASLKAATDAAYADLEPGSFGSIGTQFQRLLGAGDLDLPGDALEPEATSWGAHARSVTGEDGLPRILLVVLVGS